VIIKVVNGYQPRREVEDVKRLLLGEAAIEVITPRLWFAIPFFAYLAGFMQKQISS